MGGRITPNDVNTMEYVTNSSTGDSVDFGDLIAKKSNTSCYASSTRGISHSGYSTPAKVNTIEFVTIMTTGNSQDFGDATTVVYRE